MSIMPTSLSADVSYDLRMTFSLDGYADFDLVLASGVLNKADVEFQYRLMPGDDWLTDASISCTTALASRGSLLFGLPCSPSGSISGIRWNHADNKISNGTSCEVRVVFQPSVSASMSTIDNSHRENISSRTDRFIQKFRDKNLVGFSQLGYALCLEDKRFVAYDENLSEVVSVSNLRYPLFVQGKADEGYIILDRSGNGRLVECDLDGVVTRVLNTAPLASEPRYFYYDSLTDNLLLSGGGVHKVYEIAWNSLDFGTVLWEHGHVGPGSATGWLHHPEGVCYAEWNRNIVIIADLSNKRVVIIDRSVSPSTEEYVTSVSFGSISIPLIGPSRVSTWQGKIVIGEKSGDKQFFSSDRSVHPALVRATTRNLLPSIKDELPQYKNLVFAPILRAVE